MNLKGKRLIKLPDTLPEKVGEFNCAFNDLTSLINSPIEVVDDYTCSYNKLSSLTGAPKKVGGRFFCQKNKLTFDKIVIGLLKSKIDGNIMTDFEFDFTLFFKSNNYKKVAMLFEQEINVLSGN